MTEPFVSRGFVGRRRTGDTDRRNRIPPGQHETAQGRWIEQMPASAESPVVTGSSGGATVFSFESGPVGGDVTAAGCDSGVVTPNGTLLEAGFLSGALALAMVVGSRSRPN